MSKQHKKSKNIFKIIAFNLYFKNLITILTGGKVTEDENGTPL